MQLETHFMFTIRETALEPSALGIGPCNLLQSDLECVVMFRLGMGLEKPLCGSSPGSSGLT